MADWGGIARAVEEGLMDAESGGSSSGGGIRDIAEALTGSNFAGFKMRDIFDKDRWTRRERVNQGRRLEETGIPDYTYDYNPRDQGGSVQVDISPITGRPSDDPDNPAYIEPTPLGNIRQWGTQNPNVPGSMALDPTWAGGLRGAGLNAEVTPGEDRSIDPAILGQLRREPAWIDKPSGVQERFGDRTFSPRRGRSPFAGRFDREANSQGVTGYLPGRMSVGEARRQRMQRQDRAAAGLGDLERYDEFGRISGQFDERMGRLKNQLRDWDIEDRTRRPGIMGGGPSTRIQPDWQAIEEDMAIREMADRLQGRDDR